MRNTVRAATTPTVLPARRMGREEDSGRCGRSRATLVHVANGGVAWVGPDRPTLDRRGERALHRSSSERDRRAWPSRHM